MPDSTQVENPIFHTQDKTTTRQPIHYDYFVQIDRYTHSCGFPPPPFFFFFLTPSPFDPSSFSRIWYDIIPIPMRYTAPYIHRYTHTHPSK